MPHEIRQCRICGNTTLESLINLGEQVLTGVFPPSRDAKLTRGPLELVRCCGEKSCGLVQLRHSYDAQEMYGSNYGYRSGLNRSMVDHLAGVVRSARQWGKPQSGDLVLDIGCNDGTLLGHYPPHEATLIGMDPTGAKFRRFYRNDIQLIPDFFAAGTFRKVIGRGGVKIITSIAMFYDLESPQAFVNEIADLLADDGIWYCEQSYLPLMLERNAYDTICHEHLEYYALAQIEWLLKRAGLRLIDVELNDINGGSFAFVAAKIGSSHQANDSAIDRVVASEKSWALDTDKPYRLFAKNVEKHRNELIHLLGDLKKQGKRVLGYGASTKGNVILQYCGLDERSLPAIADVNEDKHGKFTPGTGIPIISESDAHAMKPDYFLVLPWHFRDNLIHREQAYLAHGGKLIFPLPQIENV